MRLRLNRPARGHRETTKESASRTVGLPKLSHLAILLTLNLVCFIIDKAHFFFTGDQAWMAFEYGLLLQLFAVCVVLYTKYGYSDLRVKYVAFITCAWPVIQGYLFIIQEEYSLDAYSKSAGVLIGCSLAWMFYALFRRYSLPSDDLTDDAVYIIAKPPESFVTFLASIFSRGGYGRYSYYVKGSVYHYKADKFRQTPFALYDKATDMEGAVFIRTNKNVEKAHLRLIKKLGSKWSLWNNCMMVLWHV